MNKPVKLDDIIDGMEMQTGESSSFLNIRTGKIVTISDEEPRAAEEDKSIDMFPEWQHELINIAKGILNKIGDGSLFDNTLVDNWRHILFS